MIKGSGGAALSDTILTKFNKIRYFVSYVNPLFYFLGGRNRREKAGKQKILNSDKNRQMQMPVLFMPWTGYFAGKPG